MQLKLSVPSKTFLVGEYFVTQDGASIIVNTQPRFELIVNYNCNGNHDGIDPHSPAGKYIQKQAEILNDYKIDFKDPYFVKGGFGASSAQFITTYVAHKHLLGLPIEPHLLLQSYWQCCWQGVGIRPSGADVLSQLTGGVAYFDSKTKMCEQFTWPFNTINFYILQTKNKVPTHLHLQEVIKFSVDEFKPIMEKALKSLQTANELTFIESINQYGCALANQSLVHEKTQLLLAECCQYDFILAAKGCGALGADAIILFTNNTNEDKIKKLAADYQLSIIASNSDLTQGLEITEE